MSRNRCCFVLLSAVLLAASPAWAGWPYATTGQQSNYIHEATRLKNLDPFFFQSPFFPAFDDCAKVTSITRRYPFDPRAMGGKRAKGKVQHESSCVSSVQSGSRSLGKNKRKFDNYGNAATTTKVTPNKGCDFWRTTTSFIGSQKQSAKSSVETINSVQRLPPSAPDECFDLDVLCLLDGRFKAEIDWRDFADDGSAVPISTGFDSGIFYFFNPDGDTATIQVLDQCDFNDHFWVFAAAATSFAYDLTVTDTMTGASQVYENVLGQRAPAVVDTSAFATCP